MIEGLLQLVNCASYGHDARAVGDEASTRTAMDAVTTPS